VAAIDGREILWVCGGLRTARRRVSPTESKVRIDGIVGSLTIQDLGFVGSALVMDTASNSITIEPGPGFGGTALISERPCSPARQRCQLLTTAAALSLLRWYLRYGRITVPELRLVPRRLLRSRPGSPLILVGRRQAACWEGNRRRDRSSGTARSSRRGMPRRPASLRGRL
jgi:hypothetical protein